MTALNEASVRSAAAQADPTTKERTHAERMLNAWRAKDESITASDEMIKLFLGLQSLKPGGRVSVKELKKWNATAVASTMLKQSFWLLAKARRPDLREISGIKEHLVDPWSLDAFPADLPRDEYWVIDQCVPRHVVGPGALVLESAAGTSYTQSMNPSGQNPAGVSAILPAPGAPSTAPAQSEASPALHAVVPASVAVAPSSAPLPFAPPRLLKERSSDPDDQEAIAENIARCTRAACDKKQFLCQCEEVPDTVEFWLRKYKEYILAEHGREGQTTDADWEKKLAPHMRVYVKFLVKILLQERIFKDIAVFSRHFKDIKAVSQHLVPALGDAIVSLAAVDVAGDDPLQISYLTMANASMFYQSELYQDYLAARFAATLARLKQATEMADGNRRDGVLRLMEQATTDGEKATLAFAATWFGKMSMEEKVKYLIGSSDHSVYVRDWQPDSPFSQLAMFGSVSQSFKEVDAGVFHSAVQLLLPMTDAHTAIAHPFHWPPFA